MSDFELQMKEIVSATLAISENYDTGSVPTAIRI